MMVAALLSRGVDPAGYLRAGDTERRTIEVSLDVLAEAEKRSR